MNIKIEYKGKVHKLAPNLKSLEDIHNDIRVRYPKQFLSGIVLGFCRDGQLTYISTYSELEELSRKQAGGSVKLRLFEKGKEVDLSKEISEDHYERKPSTCVFEVVDLAEITESHHQEDSKNFLKGQIRVCAEGKIIQGELENPTKSEKVPEELKLSAPQLPREQPKPSRKQQCKVELKDEAKQQKVKQQKVKQMSKVQPMVGEPNPKKKYSCFFCKATGAGSNGLVCQVCEGQKTFDQGHPFIGFIDEIMVSRLKILLERERIQTFESKPRSPEKESAPKQAGNKLSGKNFNFAFAEAPENRVSVRYNSEFLWTMKLRNSGMVPWPNRVYVYRIVSGSHQQIFQIPRAAPGENIEIAIGFKAARRNSLELFDLRLGYVDLYDGVVFFGQKFGFEVDTRSEKQPEKLRDPYKETRKRVEEACKYVPGQKHPMGYLVNRIMELNLGDEPENGMLVDVINSLQ